MVNSVESATELFSSKIAAISSLKMVLSSEVPRYLSLETRFSMRSIIFIVVVTPTSELTNTSSKLSRTSSSMVDFPAIARDNLENTDSLVFSKPLSNASFLSFEKMLLNQLICLY